MGKTVTFWTTGSDFTHLVRGLWKEGKPYNALECLEGLDMEVRLDIVEGRLKLEGDTREGDGTLSVVKDNQTGKTPRQVFFEIITAIAEKMDKGSRRVNITALVKNAEYINTAANLNFDIDYEIERIVFEMHEKREQARREEEEEEKEREKLMDEAVSAMVSRFTGAFTKDEPEWSTEATFQKLSTQQREIMRITNSNGRDLCGEHIEYQNYLWTRGILAESPRLTQYNSAWINPEGWFYGCPDMKHTEAAELILETLGVNSINAERELEKRGWIKLSAGRIVYDEGNPILPYIPQWECVLEWMRNDINENALSGKRIYNTQKGMYFTADLIEQNVAAAKKM